VPELRLGVLAIQGGFEAHREVLRELGAEVTEVRLPADLERLDGLVIPGGESTTISMGISSAGLEEPIRSLHGAGGTVFGSCAGLMV
jgi:5'-phosphate synthase pdxT subunit